MLLISAYGGIAGPISQIWYIRDYWKPETITGWPISFEDVLFGFFIAGIASVAYEILFKKHVDEKKRKQAPHKRALAFAAITAIVIARAVSINSIYDSFILFLVLALTILLFRRDLFVDSVVSGCLMALCFLISYVIFLNLFPDADIVADKFHVIKHVNSVIDLCRVAVEKSVNERFQIKRLMLMKMETFNKIKNKPKWKR